MRLIRDNRWGLVLAIMIFSFICPLFLGSSAIAQTETAIDFQTFVDDYDEANLDFSQYDDGDLVLIEDTIHLIRYDDSEDRTKIWFKSEDDQPYSKFLSIIGDETYLKFKKDEKITANIHIKADRLGHENYSASYSDLKHITKIEVDEEKHGINLLGFHIEFPEQVKFLDNNIGRFLLQFSIWVLIAVCVLLILDPVVKGATERTATKIDDIILDIIRKPILALIILYGIVSSLQELELPENFMYWVNGAYSVGFYLMMVWIGYKIFQGVLVQVGHAMTKRTGYQVDKILVPAIHKIGTIMIGFIALGAIMGYMKVDLTMFIAGGMVVSMVIAFAAQDTLSNFFSGIFLILEPKFKEGDMILFEGDTYIVKKIGMRTTVMYDLFKNIDVVMPNNKLANEKLVNITEPDRKIKDSCSVGVAYGSDPQKVQDLLSDVVSKHPDVINDDPKRESFTRFTKFGDSSIDFKVGFWVRDLDDRFRVVSEINQEIYYRLAKEGIEIPFPQRDLNIKDTNKNTIINSRKSRTKTNSKKQILKRKK